MKVEGGGILHIGGDARFCLLFILAVLKGLVKWSPIHSVITSRKCAVTKMPKLRNSWQFKWSKIHFPNLRCHFLFKYHYKKTLMHLNNVSSLTQLDKCVYKRLVNVLFVYKNRTFTRPTCISQKVISFFFFLLLFGRCLLLQHLGFTSRSVL